MLGTPNCRGGWRARRLAAREAQTCVHIRGPSPSHHGLGGHLLPETQLSATLASTSGHGQRGRQKPWGQGLQESGVAVPSLGTGAPSGEWPSESTPKGPQSPRTVTRPAAVAPSLLTQPSAGRGRANHRAGEVWRTPHGPRARSPRYPELKPSPGPPAAQAAKPGAICMRHPHVLREHDAETHVHRQSHACHTMVPWAPPCTREVPTMLPEEPIMLWEPCSAWRSPHRAPGGAPVPRLEEPCSALERARSALEEAPIVPLEAPPCSGEAPLCSGRPASVSWWDIQGLTGLWPWRCHNRPAWRGGQPTGRGRGHKQGSAAPFCLRPTPIQKETQHWGFSPFC